MTGYFEDHFSLVKMHLSSKMLSHLGEIILTDKMNLTDDNQIIKLLLFYMHVDTFAGPFLLSRREP